jgi:endogenous inhibitor of DNA gyrase (YacG/DUF329 family)
MKTEPRQNVLLQAAELQWLIDKFGVVVYPKSPLASLPAPAHGKSRQFKSRGLLEPEWRSALTLLAHPQCRVRVVTPGPVTTRIAFFYASPDAPKQQFVGCWAEDGGFRVSFPWSPNDIADTAADVLAVDSPIAAKTFSAQFSPAASMALMAAADAIRDIHLQSLLKRRPAAAFELDEAMLQRQIVAGYTDEDPRWSVTLLRFTAPPDLVLPSDALELALRELQSAHLLSRNRRAWQPTDTLLEIAAGWRTSLPAIAHELVAVDPAGGKILTYRHCVALRGEGPLWIIDYQGLPDGPPNCLLRSLDGKNYRKHLAALLQIPPPVPASTTAQSAAAAVKEVKCPNCGQTHDPRARFCPWCGATRAQPAPAAVTEPKKEKPAQRQKKQYSRDVVEALAQLLQAARDIDLIDAGRFKKLHAAFRGEDARGKVWTVGLKSLKWYQLESGQWVAAKPPAKLAMDLTLVNEIETLHPAPNQDRANTPNLRSAAEIALSKASPPVNPRQTPARPPPLPIATAESKCPKCGRQVSRAQAKFCPGCGTRLS